MGYKIIFHIDLNSFYASCEVLREPGLRGKPLIVAGDRKKGVVTTASYEARAFGIHAAMPTYKAIEKCPNIVIRPPDIGYYKQVSNAFFALLYEYTDLIEIASIDECYMDVTALCDDKTCEAFALMLQQKVFTSLGLTISIGIAPNKFLAKMASDMKKPNGLTVLTTNRIPMMMWPLPIGDMHGIGKVTSKRLIALGIKTIGDLAHAKYNSSVRALLGKQHLVYVGHAIGYGSDKVQHHKHQLQSIGSSTTFDSPTQDETLLLEYLLACCEDVVKRAQSKELIGKTITVTLRDVSFKTITRSLTLEDYTNQLNVIYEHATVLFQHHFEDHKLRLIGVSLGQIIHQNFYFKQLSLFD